MTEEFDPDLRAQLLLEVGGVPEYNFIEKRGNVLNHIADAMQGIEQNNIRVKYLLMNHAMLSRLFSTLGGRDVMEKFGRDIPVEQMPSGKGCWGTLWGAEVWVSRKVPHNTILLTADQDHLDIEKGTRKVCLLPF